MKRLKCHYLPGRLRDPLLARHHRSMLALILLLACNLASVLTEGSLADPSVIMPRWKHHTPSDHHHHGMRNTNLKGDMSGLFDW